MKKTSLLLLMVMTVLSLGCVKKTHTPVAGMSGASQPPAPAVPQGMAIGQFYISALKENCYELIPTNYTEVPQAICLRGESWTVVPGVLAQTPRTMMGAP